VKAPRIYRFAILREPSVVFRSGFGSGCSLSDVSGPGGHYSYDGSL
jgi:hypothetical protein